MNTSSGKVAYMTTGILAIIYVATIILLYLFDGNIGGKLLYVAIASGVFCVYLIYAVFSNAWSLVQQPFSAYIIIGFYLIVCLLLCFPNRYFDDFALVYLIAIPIAVFHGFQHSLVTLVAIVVVLAVSGRYEALEIQHIGYSIIACAMASGQKSKGMDVASGIVAFLLQGIVLLISRREGVAELTELGIIVLNSIAIPGIYRLAQLKEQGQNATEVSEVGVENTELITEPLVENAPISSETEKEETEEDNKVQVVDYSKYPLDIAYLISNECEVLIAMKSFAPRAFERAMEIATFAQKIAYKFGANSDLVYAAALYHDVDKIYKETPGASIVLPEYLYTIVKRQNEKVPPASMEELIVLLSNHVLAIHHYMEKNNSNISITKVIENIFNLQLKKGSIMSAGISMSVYHKMKQEVTNEFMRYLEKNAADK